MRTIGAIDINKRKHRSDKGKRRKRYAGHPVKPKRKKLYCPGCDRWHDTQKQIDACVLSSQRFVKVAEKQVKQEQIDENTELKKRLADLEAKINKLMEAKV